MKEETWLRYLWREEEEAQVAGIFNTFLVNHSHKCEATLSSLSHSLESNKDSVPH